MRYVIVGGLATVLHGYTRLTDDVDLVIDLAPEAARRTMEALRDLGLKPRAPVELLDFALADRRRQWNEEKGMRVFSLVDPAQPMRELDLFVENPLEFEMLWRDSVVKDLGECSVRIASIPHLIRMKRAAGRPQDLLDIDALEIIAKNQRGAVSESYGGGWEAHRKDQLIRGLAASPAQRLEWLDSAIELAWHTGALPRKRNEILPT
ncbi:MAG TPA: hypothetical protein VFV19_09860 [Candidatus Polarisedimenticolaceae bacterium]|nr:hypothetical protein [Candidatus Polarisedimenticolaceae bacterium]